MKACGGMDELPAEDLCDACLSRPGTLRFTCTITRAEAAEAVRQWSASRRIAPSWRRQDWATASCRLRYLPFWLLTAHVTGYVKGYRIVSDEVSDREIPMDVTLDNDFFWTWTAGRSGDLGVWSLRTLTGETHLFRKDFIPMSDMTVPRTAALSEGIRALPDAVLNSCKVPEITEKEVRIQDIEDIFVLYPFWMVRHASSSPTSFALVDGVIGDLVSGRLPGNFSWRWVMFAVATALSVLGVALSIYVTHYFFLQSERVQPERTSGLCSHYRSGFDHGVSSCMGLFVSEAFLFARYGSEVTYGEVKGGYNTSQHVVSARTVRAWPGIIFGFAAMVYGGFLFTRSCDWQAAAQAIGGLVLYPGFCMSRSEVGRVEDLIACGYVTEEVA